MDYFAGIDVGSLSTEVVILDAVDRIIGYSIVETGANSTEAAETAFNQALIHADISREHLLATVTTGYGRESVSRADKKVTEISCHALGAYHQFPDIGTVIDIGGQKSPQSGNHSGYSPGDCEPGMEHGKGDRHRSPSHHDGGCGQKQGGCGPYGTEIRETNSHLQGTSNHRCLGRGLDSQKAVFSRNKYLIRFPYND